MLDLIVNSQPQFRAIRRRMKPNPAEFQSRHFPTQLTSGAGLQSSKSFDEQFVTFWSSYCGQQSHDK